MLDDVVQCYNARFWDFVPGFIVGTLLMQVIWGISWGIRGGHGEFKIGCIMSVSFLEFDLS